MASVKQPLPISATLRGLAGTDLRLYRADRYDGGGFSVSLRSFAPEDVSLMVQLYNGVKRTYDLWLYMKDAPNYDMLARHVHREFGSDRYLAAMRAIGSATYTLGAAKPDIRKIIHDVRGGALVVLVGYARLLGSMPSGQAKWDDVKIAIFNARDHAKLMRNAIDDLDPLVREADENIKVHYIDEFANKWSGVDFNIAQKSVKISVNCTFEGSITNRCLETSAIDRILYNYINNAARFAADDGVNLSIFAVNKSLVRWVVDNAITGQHEQWLAENTGDDLKKLFSGGVTRGGHGLGLSNCADFVAASFGITPQQALDQGYLGAKLIDGRYYAWFHWPAYVPQADDPDCDCEPA